MITREARMEEQVYARARPAYLLAGKLSGSIDDVRDGEQEANDEDRLSALGTSRYSSGRPVPDDERRTGPSSGAVSFSSVAEASEDRWIRWMRD